MIPDDEGACLVADSEPLSSAETYGDFLTHPRGHYEVWTFWQRQGAGWLKARDWPLTIQSYEYEAFPRGRVVFHTPTRSFWIYTDRRLQRPATIALVKRALGLSQATCLVKSDSHYR